MNTWNTIDELKATLNHHFTTTITLTNDMTAKDSTMLPIKVQGNYTLVLKGYTITTSSGSDKTALFKLQGDSHLMIQNTKSLSYASLFIKKGIGIEIANSSNHSITLSHAILNSGSYGVIFEYGNHNALTLINSTIHAIKIGIYSAGDTHFTKRHQISLKGNSKVLSTDYDSIYLSGCTYLNITDSTSIHSIHSDGIYTYCSNNEIYLCDNASITGSNGITMSYPDNKLTISGTPTITGTDGVGLFIGNGMQKDHIILSGGTFYGTKAAIEISANCNLTLDALLADGCDYYDTKTGAKLNLEGQTLVKGMVTVKKASCCL